MVLNQAQCKTYWFFWFWSFSFRLWEWLNVAGEHLFCPRVVANLWGIDCCGCMSPQIMSLPSCLHFHLLHHLDPDQKSPLLKSSVQAKVQWHSGGIWFGMGNCRQHNIHYLQNPEILRFYILGSSGPAVSIAWSHVSFLGVHLLVWTHKNSKGLNTKGWAFKSLPWVTGPGT